jgi:hypothetical protein
MSFKQKNPGLLSAIRGGEIIAFSFRVNGTSAPNGLVQGLSNAVVSVTYEDVGKTFEVTLNKPWPRQIIAGFVQAMPAAGQTVLHAPRIVKDDYDTADGTFHIENITDANGDGTYAASVLPDNTTVQVLLIVQTQDALVESPAS